MTCQTWPIVWPKDKPAGCTDVLEAAAVAGAQELLWARTGRRLGTCTTVETYDLRTGRCYYPWPYGGGVVARSIGGMWHTGGVWLEQQPVQSVESVSFDGLVLTTDEWRLDGSMLIRVGDGFRAGTVEVAYTYGEPIVAPLDALVRLAMGEVAMDLLSGLCGGPCKIPSRATSVTRQGVTVTRGTPTNTNLIGLPIADQLIGILNPRGLPSQSRVYSPDVPPARSVTV